MLICVLLYRIIVSCFLGLWSDLVGKYIRINLPSSSIRDIDDIQPVLEDWDGVVSFTGIAKFRHNFFF